MAATPPVLNAGQRGIMARAAAEVRAERRRQVYEENYLPARDDEHEQGELALAAAAYIGVFAIAGASDLWPWPMRPMTPKSTRRNLVIAAALLLAEIERIDRATAKAAELEPPLPLEHPA